MTFLATHISTVATYQRNNFLFLQIKCISYRWQVPIPAYSWTGIGALLEQCVRHKLLGVLVLKSKHAAENNKCTYESEIQIGGICLKTRGDCCLSDWQK